jgi:aldehyde:ferredoxin oxidoreductase
MHSVTGCLVNVDLSTGKTSIESVRDDTFRRFLGGNGLAIKILVEKMAAGQHPFSSENVLFFGTGPLTATVVPASDRMILAAKSPQTRLFFDSSMGGRIASSLKLAGGCRKGRAWRGHGL